MGARHIGVGKREMLARFLYRSGIASALRQLPQRDLLLVLNYHRIGNPEETPFDPGVFSATAEEFDDQVGYLKRHMSLVTLDEAVSLIGGSNTRKDGRCRVLITFDDGYLDNYQVAFPILRSHGAQGVFFLVTSFAGTSHVPWWDNIAYTIKSARKRRFTLRYPAQHDVDLDRNDLAVNLQRILALYKRPDNTDSERFLAELQESCEGTRPAPTDRCFLSWDEAREMLRGGMSIGSHTHKHEVLSQLTPEEQWQELTRSREVLKEKLGLNTATVAYPVGNSDSFTSKTLTLAEQAGYRAGFSFYGGTNLPRRTNRFNVLRVGIDGQSRERFRVQTIVGGLTGHYWP